MKILVVCLGNICRSPMAHGLLRHKADDRGMSIVVDSAGTSAYHIDEPPDRRMQATASKYGVDISDLRARQFVTEDYDRFDLIYAMDESNYENMLGLARNDEDKAKLKMILNEVYPGKNMPVPDPYFGGDQGFEDVFNLLDEACEVILNKVSDAR